MKRGLAGRLRTVRQKLLAGVLLATAAALLVTLFAWSAYEVRSYHAQRVADIRTQAALIGVANEAALQFDDPKFATQSLSVLRVRPLMVAAAIYDAKGKVFASYVRKGDQAAFPPLPGAEGARVANGEIVVVRPIVEGNEVLGTVYLRADYRLWSRLGTFALILAGVAAAALIVAVLLSAWLQANLTDPIQEVSALAREVVERRDYSVRARRRTDDEIGVLVDAFNGMLAEIEARTRQLEREVEERSRAEAEVRRLAESLEARVRGRTAELEEANRELESFSYSVSHDLRAPLRAIDGFSQALLEDYGRQADEPMLAYLRRIRAATLRMSQLIDDLLKLARISRVELAKGDVDLAAIAGQVVRELQAADPERKVEISIWDDVKAKGDPRLLRIVLENLLGNAWKFTSRTESPRIELGALHDRGRTVYFVRDNGVGFDMAHADKLFGAFQRLHAPGEFPGTGIGLANVQRIVHRHGGRVWAQSQPGKGAVFFFTLQESQQTKGEPWREPRQSRSGS